MTMASRARLLLDEMFSPTLAAALRDLGHDVIAVAERSDLRSMTDSEILAWATK
jgi:predicted nuclease of predicted toxin-antitoxin system